MSDICITTTGDYERLVPFFIENELEFTEEDAVETPTDILKCWKATDGEEPAEDSEGYENGKKRLVGGFVLAERDGEYICDGIAIDAEYRKYHFGKKLLDLGIEEVKRRGGRSMYLVARAPGFFRKSGFETVKREDAPNFFECLTCPQYDVSCFPEVMRLDFDKQGI